MKISIEIRGQNGTGTATFLLTDWKAKSPVSRVLAIHEQRRDLTAGQPFDVVREWQHA